METIFEYTWDTLSNYIGVVEHAALLQKRGEEGWDMVSVIIIEVGSDKRMRIYWKRIKNKDNGNN